MDSFRPLVRFAGFQGEWERVCIGDLGTTYSGLSGKGKSDFGDGNAFYITFLNVLNNAVIDVSKLERVNIREAEKQNMVRKGDLLFNTSSETPEEVGFCSFVADDLENVYLNSFCFGFRIDSSICGTFFSYIMRSNVGRRLMAFLAQGATRYNLSKKNFCNSFISLPSLPEQQSISNYFTKLDEELTLQTQKLSKLKQIKAASLQNMFPQEGETVPLVRFSGFGGEWKKVPFAEIAVRAEQSGVSGELPGVEYEDIVSGQGILNKDILKKECVKCGKLFHSGDILFGKLRPYLKNILFADFDGVAVGDFWVLRSTNSVNRFLYTIVNSYSFMKVANVSSGSKMPRADWKLVSSTRFAVPPTIEEQQAIANYFTKLDRKIDLETQKLAKLKQIKTACLSKMFV